DRGRDRPGCHLHGRRIWPGARNRRHPGGRAIQSQGRAARLRSSGRPFPGRRPAVFLHPWRDCPLLTERNLPMSGFPPEPPALTNDPETLRIERRQRETVGLQRPAPPAHPPVDASAALVPPI